ncbi:pyridoxal kinase-like [Uranotaenia lowii]|uniref:pyridoxal kinase-like n=1 Tax=Uranotaenia lowii TaxID=190385 RepID=UPI00247AB483|nr:pyridoxal kinase-like [Uranotaenia lowii]
MDGSFRVLAIQSHVAHGYVGNKCAAFPLQVLGFEVDNINSVQFSNHTGYENGFKGQMLNEKELSELYSGLEGNNLHLLYTHLLTGYVRDPCFLKEIASILKSLKSTNPKLIYLCDPVMGDDGFMYVPKELLPIYRNEIIPLADIATPNQYEAELLTERSIKSEAEARGAMEWFHRKGVETVCISSAEFEKPNTLYAFVSHENENSSQRYCIEIPKQGNGIRFTGTGDLFAALFLAHATLTGFDMKTTLEKTVATVQAVIGNTLENIPEPVKEGKVKVTSAQRELKLIQTKSRIECPEIKLLCQPF